MKAKHINIAFWTVFGVSLTGAVCYQWYIQGAGAFSIIAGIIFYGVFSLTGAVLINDMIKQK